jgi:hypothetical protein
VWLSNLVAGENAAPMLVEERTAVGTLRAVLAQDGVLFGRQRAAPICVAAGEGIGDGGARRARA